MTYGSAGAEVLENNYSEEAQRIGSLMQTIGDDDSISVRVSDEQGSNYFDWKNREVHIDTNDIQRNEEEWLGISSHEAMHCRITRWENIPEDLLRQPGFNQIMQTMEDIRVYQATAKMYPGAGEWMRKAVAAEVDGEGRMNLEKIQRQCGGELGYIPHSVRYCVEMQKRWVAGIIDNSGVPDRVMEALNKTYDETEDIINTLPDVEDSEEDIQKSADHSYEVIKDKIFPEFEKLMEIDKRNESLRQTLLYIVEDKKDGQAFKELLEETLEPDELEEFRAMLSEVETLVKKRQEGQNHFLNLDAISQKLQQKINSAKDTLLPENKSKDLDKKAQETLDKLEDKITEQLRPKLQNPENAETHEERAVRIAVGRSRRVGRLADDVEDEDEAYINETASKLTYDEVVDQYRSQIDKLYEKLNEILTPNKFPRWKKGFSTGTRVNEQEAMQFDADPRRYNRLMDRLNVPEKRDFRFTLLVDLSGSMGGENIENAFKSVVVFTEVLSRLGIDFEVLGFNTVPVDDKEKDKYVFKEYGKDLTRKHKDKIQGMLKEVHRSPAGYNDDGPALDWASKRLDQHAGRDNFLLAISDGAPAYSEEYAEEDGGWNSKPKPEFDLENIVTKVMKKGNQHLIGLGIGAGVHPVSKYYPNNRLVPNVEELIPVIADLLEDIVKNPHKYKFV